MLSFRAEDHKQWFESFGFGGAVLDKAYDDVPISH